MQIQNYMHNMFQKDTCFGASIHIETTRKIPKHFPFLQSIPNVFKAKQKNQIILVLHRIIAISISIAISNPKWKKTHILLSRKSLPYSMLVTGCLCRSVLFCS